MPLYDYLTPKLDFKRKFNHRQSFLYKGRLTVRTIRKFRIVSSLRIESRIGSSIRNRVCHHSCSEVFILLKLWALLQRRRISKLRRSLNMSAQSQCDDTVSLTSVSRPHYPLCRLYHGRGPPAARGPPINCQFLPRCVDVRWRLKKGRQVFGRRKVDSERESTGYAYEKRAPALRWYGAPEWLIRPWSVSRHVVVLWTCVCVCHVTRLCLRYVIKSQRQIKPSA